MNKNIRRLCILILLGILFFSSSALSKETKNPPLNVLIITVDTLRADHVGCYGYRPIKTPQIDALAGEGVLFEKAFTPVPTTLPAHVSLFTGTYPITHGIKNNGTFALTESAVTLAEQIQAAEYNTAAFIASFVLDSRFGLDQGFNVYDDDFSIDPGDMRAGAGIGIRFVVPNLRIPISLDYAWPIDRDRLDSKSPRFEFSLTPFSY